MQRRTSARDWNRTFDLSCVTAALVAETVVFKIKAQLSTAVQPDVWMARLLERLDGRHSVAEIYNIAQESGDLPGDFALVSFTNFVSKMIEYGLLEIDAPPDS